MVFTFFARLFGFKEERAVLKEVGVTEFSSYCHQTYPSVYFRTVIGEPNATKFQFTELAEPLRQDLTEAFSQWLVARPDEREIVINIPSIGVTYVFHLDINSTAPLSRLLSFDYAAPKGRWIGS